MCKVTICYLKWGIIYLVKSHSSYTLLNILMIWCVSGKTDWLLFIIFTPLTVRWTGRVDLKISMISTWWISSGNINILSLIIGILRLSIVATNLQHDLRQVILDDIADLSKPSIDYLGIPLWCISWLNMCFKEQEVSELSPSFNDQILTTIQDTILYMSKSVGSELRTQNSKMYSSNL